MNEAFLFAEGSEDAPCTAVGLNMYATLSDYLYPIVIEFALIEAAIIYRIVTSIGALVNPGYSEWVSSQQIQKKKVHNHECHKATSGVMFGLIVFTTMFAVTLTFMISDDTVLNGYLYLGGDLAVHVVALVACAIAFFKVSKLTFAGDVENPLDEYLIVICLGGMYFLVGAKMVAAFDALGEDEEQDTFNILYIVWGFISFIQASFQVVFIIDGFRREATTRQHQHEKPGRSVISFLLFSNLAMWLINSFQLKETYQSSIMRDFYGDLAWTIILYLTLPLAVFFRFHSVVCLSDIWIEAYKKRCHALFKIRPEDVHHDHDHDHGHKNIAHITTTPNNIAVVDNDLFPNNFQANESDSELASTRL